MVCKNCGSEIPENNSFCRVCGKTVGKEKKEFKLEIPKEKLENKSEEKKSNSEKTKPTTEKSEIIKEEDIKPQVIAEKTEKKEALEKTENKNQSQPLTTEKKLELSAKKAAERKIALQKEKKKKKVKNADILMKTLVCLCAVVTVALTFVSGFTGVFRDDGTEKTVALSILLPSDSELFEKTVVKYACLFDEGYNAENRVYDDMLSYMKPESSAGLYAAVNKKAQVERTEPDPDGRFDVNEEGTGEGYTKVSSKNVKKVLSSISLSNLKDANDENCYYYDGYYYFKSEKEVEKKDLSAKVSSAKKTSEGNYYIVCTITPQKGEQYNMYFLASLKENNKAKSWIIKKISKEPLYDDFGNGISKEDGKESLSYEMKRKTFTSKTKDGTVYAKYVIEYPYFSSQGTAETSINALYSQKLESLRSLAKKGTSQYKKYISSGGSKEDLPLYTHIISSVKYNENGYFSIVERTSEYNPLNKTESTTAVSTTVEADLTENNAPYFAKTTFESYAFNIESGEFVKKDDITGKDYLSVQNILYRTYLGMDDNSQEAVPNDVNGIGAKIYASQWALTKEGLMFCFTEENGVKKEITVPYEKLTDRTIMK